MTILSDDTKLRAKKINEWCLSQGSDFATNFVRDLKSLKALWNYLMLMLFTWVCVWCVLYHAKECANTVIVTVGGLVGTIFTGYIWASNAEKRAAQSFPAYSNPDNPTKPAAAPDTTEDPGNG